MVLKIIINILFRVELDQTAFAAIEKNKKVYICNFSSFLDPWFLSIYLDQPVTVVIDACYQKHWLHRLFARSVKFVYLDSKHPFAIRGLLKRINNGETFVFFPPSRLDGSGNINQEAPGIAYMLKHCQADIVPICINGAHRSRFSSFKGKTQQHWFRQVQIGVVRNNLVLKSLEKLNANNRQTLNSHNLARLMTDIRFDICNYRQNLLDAVLESREINGGKCIVLEDIERKPMDLNNLILKTTVLGAALARATEDKERIGIMLPNSLACAVSFFALIREGRIPAMLNFSSGERGLIAACETAQLKQVITSKKFIKKAELHQEVLALKNKVNVIYLENIAKTISLKDKLKGVLYSKSDYLYRRCYKNKLNRDSDAVILFTSGSEGLPKGVLLSHGNLLTNMIQLESKIDFFASDVVLNALPMFHSFGLGVATLLTMTTGMHVFLYPSPLHYRIIPELARDINCTILFGTNTFLAGYARYAKPEDFAHLRFVFTGAEKLTPEVRRVWKEKYKAHIYEGYGATETSPVISANTPRESKLDSVGRAFPGIESILEPVPGIEEGGRLWVSGPNVMQGYLLHDQPGEIIPPSHPDLGEGWYDTGDIVVLDENDYITIAGRAKRFAKIGGEMVSLSTVESLANKAWPDASNAAIILPDRQKGEQIVLLTTHAEADRKQLLSQARETGLSELNVPKKIMANQDIPVLGTGKTDYVQAKQLAEVNFQ
ncbi:MAG: AMP-binding protein [Gammaproteobacteria bacterium]|nr:AMP-binding protein [Gammaproteobacteria bacterium]